METAEKQTQPRGRKRQIAFDLNQEHLKKYYPKPKFTLNPNYHRKAYTDIRLFMEKNGFEHRQGSVYVSQKPMTTMDIGTLVRKMAQEMPWLSQCADKLDVTQVGKQHSLTKTLKEATQQVSALTQENTQEPNRSAAKEKVSPSMRMDDWKSQIAAEREKSSGKDAPTPERGLNGRNDRC